MGLVALAVNTQPRPITIHAHRPLQIAPTFGISQVSDMFPKLKKFEYAGSCDPESIEVDTSWKSIEYPQLCLPPTDLAGEWLTTGDRPRCDAARKHPTVNDWDIPAHVIQAGRHRSCVPKPEPIDSRALFDPTQHDMLNGTPLPRSDYTWRRRPLATPRGRPLTD